MTALHDPDRFAPYLRLTADGALLHWCPACLTHHRVFVANPDGLVRPLWRLRADPGGPTLSPSVRVRSFEGDAHHVCHYFLRAGWLEFLTDCTHALAGQRVPLPEGRW